MSFPTFDDMNAIRGVILAQIEAFLADDAERAFSFASSLIQARFESPEIFLGMVREYYEAVHRPQRVEFGRLRPDGEERAVQLVYLIGEAGQRHTAHYELRLEGWAWRVTGCLLDWVAE